MDDMVLHCEAVSRGSKPAGLSDWRYAIHVISNIKRRGRLENAGRFICAGMDCVKGRGRPNSKESRQLLILELW